MKKTKDKDRSQQAILLVGISSRQSRGDRSQRSKYEKEKNVSNTYLYYIPTKIIKEKKNCVKEQ